MTDSEIIEWLESHDNVGLEREQSETVPWSVKLGYRTIGIGMHLRDAVEQARAMEVQAAIIGPQTFDPDR